MGLCAVMLSLSKQCAGGIQSLRQAQTDIQFSVSASIKL